MPLNKSGTVNLKKDDGARLQHIKIKFEQGGKKSSSLLSPVNKCRRNLRIRKITRLHFPNTTDSGKIINGC